MPLRFNLFISLACKWDIVPLKMNNQREVWCIIYFSKRYQVNTKFQFITEKMYRTKHYTDLRWFWFFKEKQKNAKEKKKKKRKKENENYKK